MHKRCSLAIMDQNRSYTPLPTPPQGEVQNREWRMLPLKTSVSVPHTYGKHVRVCVCVCVCVCVRVCVYVFLPRE